MPRIDNIIRHREGIYQVVTEPTLGTYIRPGDDPTAEPFPEEYLKALVLPDDFPKVDARTWAAFRDLCFRYVRHDANPNTPIDSTAEVAVVFIRHGDDFREWDAWAPEQIVGGARVKSDLRPGNTLVNIVTGEVEDGGLAGVIQRYPQGAHGGSAHSHNTMGVGFSSIDDGSELKVPGLHAICGRIRQVKARDDQGRFTGGHTLTYAVGPSITMGGRRFQKVTLPCGTIRPMLANDIIDREGADTRYPYDPERPWFHADVVESGIIRKATPAEAADSNGRVYHVSGTGSHSTVIIGDIYAGLTGLQLSGSNPTGQAWCIYGKAHRLLPVDAFPPKLKKVHAAMILEGRTIMDFGREVKPRSGTLAHTGTAAKSAHPHHAPKKPVTFSGKARMYREGRASTVDQAKYLMSLIEATLESADRDVWNTLYDGIAGLGIDFDPELIGDDDDMPPWLGEDWDPPHADDVEWIDDEGRTPTPSPIWEGARGLLDEAPPEPHETADQLRLMAVNPDGTTVTLD